MTFTLTFAAAGTTQILWGQVIMKGVRPIVFFGLTGSLWLFYRLNDGENLMADAGGQQQNRMVERGISEAFIDALSDDSHSLLRPIPIQYERIGNAFIAGFPQANIAISGLTKQDACEALEIEILDAFDDWMADESVLASDRDSSLRFSNSILESNQQKPDNMLTAADAETIARKLQAVVKEKARRHKIAIIKVNGREVGRFGFVEEAATFLMTTSLYKFM